MKISVIRVLICVMLIAASAMPSLAEGKVSFFAGGGGREIVVGVKYHANSFTEFLWGVTRPVHLWNREAGEIVVLPFWTRPMQPGGWLSWANKEAWKENPSLTLGSLLTEVVVVAAAASSGGGGGSGNGSSTPAPVTSTGSSDGGDDSGDSGGGSSGGGGGDGGGGFVEED
ncbi:hypothetical protein ACFLS1_02330 [Verrucomicrobiota bacterium]